MQKQITHKMKTLTAKADLAVAQNEELRRLLVQARPYLSGGLLQECDEVLKPVPDAAWHRLRLTIATDLRSHLERARFATLDNFIDDIVTRDSF